MKNKRVFRVDANLDALVSQRSFGRRTESQPNGDSEVITLPKENTLGVWEKSKKALDILLGAKAEK